MQRRLLFATSGALQATLRGSAVASSAAHSQRRLQSTATADAQENVRETATAGQVTGSSSPHLQQLYKSSHKGTGSTPMPKPYQERRLRPRKAPAGVTETATESPPQALFGARSSCAEDAGPVPQRSLSPLQKRQLQFRNKAAFVLTPQALRRVKYLLGHYTSTHPGAGKKAGQQEESATGPVEAPCGIRIGVRRRGCSGYSYTVNYFFDRSTAAAQAAASPAKKRGGLMEDVVVEQDGVKVVVDADALFYVIGTEMDYVVRNVEEKFTFKNPNQKYSCGCEESFMPFDADDMDDD